MPLRTCSWCWRTFRFVLFLLIFSSFYIVFWQEFISAPLFLRGYVNPNANADLVLSVDALAVICFQILVSYLTRKIATFPAMTLGLVISSLAWLILVFFPTTLGLVAALIVLALGEMTQSARYYEYISGLRPRASRGSTWVMLFFPSPLAILLPARWADTCFMSLATSCTGPAKCGGW